MRKCVAAHSVQVAFLQFHCVASLHLLERLALVH
jgi:hypothetical protein